MPMGALNSSSIFVAMTTELQATWDQLAWERDIDCSKVRTAHKCNSSPTDLTEAYRSEVIVNNMLWYAEDVDILMAYVRCALDILLLHQAIIKLKKCQFLPPTIEFVGIQLQPDGNAPA